MNYKKCCRNAMVVYIMEKHFDNFLKIFCEKFKDSKAKEIFFDLTIRKDPGQTGILKLEDFSKKIFTKVRN